MKYLVTGGTGFIGSALTESLVADGHEATVLTRRERPAQGAIRFVTRFDEIAADTHFDAVVNLAGASLAGARWTKSYKEEIVNSRLATTEGLVTLLRRLDHTPEVLLSASAIGYYGPHADETLSEDGATVPGFSQDLCQRWEEAALRAADTGIRVCLLRFGVVLGRDGGAMEAMAKPFQFGIANWVGDGGQWLSWVHRRDVISAMRFLQQHPQLSGPFNITAPEPVTARGFCTAMKRFKRTWLTAPVPAPVIRLLVGEMADELLLAGQRVVPTALHTAGFEFALPDLDTALADILAA